METINGTKIHDVEAAENYAIEKMGKDASRRHTDIAYSQMFNKLKQEWAIKNPSYLFIATHVTCYCYCDQTKMKNGDYLEIGRLYFSPLKLEIENNKPKYAEAHERMKEDFEKLSKMDTVQISQTGQVAKITH